MNVRFSANGIRLRISAEEFSDLRGGAPIGLEVSLPRGHVFRAKLNASGIDWHFDSDPTGLWISIPRSELETLANQLPSKDGVSHQFDTNHGSLGVSLEVDVKTG